MTDEIVIDARNWRMPAGSRGTTSAQMLDGTHPTEFAAPSADRDRPSPAARMDEGLVTWHRPLGFARLRDARRCYSAASCTFSRNGSAG